MPKRVLLVSVAVAAMGLVAAALGFVSERANSKSFGGFDGTYCVYRRTAALGCGVAAAVLLLAGQAVLAVASGRLGCFGRYGEAPARANGRDRAAIDKMFAIFWTMSMASTLMFLRGAWWNAGGRMVPTWGLYHSMDGCSALKGGGAFSAASIASAIAFVFGIISYVMEMADPEPRQQ